MGLPHTEWLQQAQRLKEGSSARVQHDCGEGRTMTVEHTSEGFRSWCFRCNEGGFKQHGQRSLSTLVKRWNETAGDHNDYTITLPDDVTRSGMPWPAIHWLSRASITQRLIEKYNIGYSPRYGRVYLPVYSVAGRGNARRLEYYQGRAVHDGQVPKYLNPKVNKTDLVFSTQQGDPGSTVAIVTEDILSAIRVGEISGFCGVSILGTSPSPGQINYLRKFKSCIIWLDPDDAGQKATRKLKRSFELVGQPYSVLKSERDPKLYCNRELKELLWQ